MVKLGVVCDCHILSHCLQHEGLWLMQPIRYDSSAGQPPRSRVVNPHGIWTSTIWQCMYHIHNYVCVHIYIYNYYYNHIIILYIYYYFFYILFLYYFYYYYYHHHIIILYSIYIYILLLFYIVVNSVIVMRICFISIGLGDSSPPGLLWIDPNRQLSARESQNPRRTSACWPEIFHDFPLGHWVTLWWFGWWILVSSPQFLGPRLFQLRNYNILQCIMID